MPAPPSLLIKTGERTWIEFVKNAGVRRWAPTFFGQLGEMWKKGK